MERVNDWDKCPRCAAAPLPSIVGERGSPSRQTMDGAEPIIRVCSTCREREVFGAAAGLPPIPYSRWPVPLDRLLAEDRERLRHLRSAPVSEALRIRERHLEANRLD
jgi:hypothetical protein